MDVVNKDAMFFRRAARRLSSLLSRLYKVFQHKMDVSYSESSDYYSLDS